MQTEIQRRERTVYDSHLSTTIEQRPQTVYQPVTTYEPQARLQDVLNPFKPITYRWVPRTRWQPTVQYVDTPVTRREIVPRKELVDVPVTTRRYVNDEIIRRTVVNPGSDTSVARRPSIGGVSRMESDPPRDGANWRPAGNPSP